MQPLQCAREGARCDYGLYVGASSSNSSSLVHLSTQALALKMYLNTTFSTLMLESMESWMKVLFTYITTKASSPPPALPQHVANWPKDRPLCVHAEGKTTAAILLLADLAKRPLHVCHVARKEEVSTVTSGGHSLPCEVPVLLVLIPSGQLHIFLCRYWSSSLPRRRVWLSLVRCVPTTSSSLLRMPRTSVRGGVRCVLCSAPRKTKTLSGRIWISLTALQLIMVRFSPLKMSQTRFSDVSQCII